MMSRMWFLSSQAAYTYYPKQLKRDNLSNRWRTSSENLGFLPEKAKGFISKCEFALFAEHEFSSLMQSAVPATDLIC